jgi:3-oxoacyl-[acyl-carrier-protein] synthase II
MRSSRDVVVTGLGIVSPLGVGLEPFVASLQAGQSGVIEVSTFVERGLPIRVGAPIRDFDPEKFVHRKTLKVMSREIQAAYAAADLALKHATLAKGAVEAERFGVVLGSEMLYGKVDELLEAYRHSIEGNEFQFDQWGKNAMHDIFPLWMLKYLPNMAACHIGIAHDARGPNNTIMQGENSSLMALMEGASYITRDLADVVLVGGTGSRLSEAALPYRGMLNVSPAEGDPAAISRPFDAGRTGMVNGEGAGVLVLEAAEHAARRGARPLARVLGFASRTEPQHRDAMTGQSIRNAIRAALEVAGVTPEQVGHVNANGMSTLHDDRIEAAAIRETLGDTPVTALKSYFGYLGAGCGAVELAASVCSLGGEIPPTLNYDVPDPACPLNVVREPLAGRPPVALKLNHTPLGQAAAVVIAAVP